MRKSIKHFKTENIINPSEFTLATFRGAEKELLLGETVKVSEEWKGHEKRKIIEKFLSNDEIFFKILQLLPNTGSSDALKLDGIQSLPQSH